VEFCKYLGGSDCKIEGTRVFIQFALLLAIVCVTILLGYSTTNVVHMAFRRLFLILFTVAGAVAVMFPEILTKVAATVGVGRGADLLLYTLFIAFIGSLAMQSRRAAELARKNTLINRRVAILEAELAMQNRLPLADQD